MDTLIEKAERAKELFEESLMLLEEIMEECSSERVRLMLYNNLRIHLDDNHGLLGSGMTFDDLIAELEEVQE